MIIVSSSINPIFNLVLNILLFICLIIVLFINYLEKKKYNAEKNNYEQELIKKNEELKYLQSNYEKNQSLLQNANDELLKIEKLYQESREQFSKTETELQFIAGQKNDIKSNYENSLKNLEELQKTNNNLLIEIEKLKSENELLKEKNQESLARLQQILQDNKDSFKVLAQEVANKTFTDVKKKSTEDLQNIVSPLKSEIDVFNKELKNHIHHNNSTINNFRGMFEQFTKNISRTEQSTLKLTDALIGRNKTQGSWGEWTLERVLESAGLQKEIDYKLQEHFVEENKIKRPDAVVYLPDNKHLIIDAKMSLLHYYEYINDNEEHQEKNLKALKNSIAKHVKDLSSKNYSSANEIDSISMVFLFIPIESLFQLIASDNKMIDFSYQHKIILVSPSTLYSSLYAIAYVRRLEKQTDNINNIIDEVSKFYDKCCAFFEDFVVLGKALQKASETFDHSMNKMQNGRGNLIDRMMKIKKMGVHSKKEIPEILLKENND